MWPAPSRTAPRGHPKLERFRNPAEAGSTFSTVRRDQGVRARWDALIRTPQACEQETRVRRELVRRDTNRSHPSHSAGGSTAGCGHQTPSKSTVRTGCRGDALTHSAHAQPRPWVRGNGSRGQSRVRFTATATSEGAMATPQPSQSNPCITTTVPARPSPPASRSMAEGPARWTKGQTPARADSHPSRNSCAAWWFPDRFQAGVTTDGFVVQAAGRRGHPV